MNRARFVIDYTRLNGHVLDAKRVRLPGVVVEAACPGCGRKIRKDYGHHQGAYLSYPKINETFDLDFYCGGKEGCDEEWTVPAFLKVELQPAPAPTPTAPVLPKHGDT